MTTENQPIPTAAAAQTIEIEDLDQFVKMLTMWHTEKCATVQHLLTVPVGSVFKVGDDPEVELTPESLKGFKLGVEMAMMQLGNLPFVAEVEDELEAESAAG